MYIVYIYILTVIINDTPTISDSPLSLYQMDKAFICFHLALLF